MKFVEDVNNLVSSTKTEHEHSACLNHMCQLLVLLPVLSEFWKKVETESCSSCMEDAKEHENNVNEFYHHGSFAIFANSTLGDGETFYCHVSKHWVPRLAKWTVSDLGCGVGLWTMQGFEHRNKQSKHSHSHETNGKGNCCM